MVTNKFVVAVLAITLVGGSASAQTAQCLGDANLRTCFTDDGDIITSTRDAAGTTTSSSDGWSYRTNRTGPNTSVTHGEGETYMTTRRKDGAMTVGEGQVYVQQRQGNDLRVVGADGNMYRCRVHVGGKVQCWAE